MSVVMQHVDQTDTKDQPDSFSGPSPITLAGTLEGDQGLSSTVEKFGIAIGCAFIRKIVENMVSKTVGEMPRC